MSDTQGASLISYFLLLILPIMALIARRPPLRRTLLLILAWIAIFGIGLVVVGQRDRLGMLWQDPAIEGDETHISMAEDGHFWAEVTINGAKRRMLIDSGATTTAISQATARAVGLEIDSPFPVVLSTGNGQITATSATAHLMSIGNVTVRNVPVVVSPAFGDTDVVGMNVLSRLGAWRVDGRTLILIPHS